MVIVLGSFQVEPSERAAFLANRDALTVHSRAEDGCITYAFTADNIDPTVVVLTERWTNREALDAHLAGLATAPQPAPVPAALTREIMIYQADDGTVL
jgi:quinol monooxygenase YgiN